VCCLCPTFRVLVALETLITPNSPLLYYYYGSHKFSEVKFNVYMTIYMYIYIGVVYVLLSLIVHASGKYDHEQSKGH